MEPATQTRTKKIYSART